MMSGLLRFQSPLLTESLLLSFPPGTQMFQFSGSTFVQLCIHYTILALPASGFPHSDIYGSLRTYCSPQHFAVSCVLHRLLVPRHPLCALCFFTLHFFLSFKRILLTLKSFFLNLRFKFYTLRQVLFNFQRSINTMLSMVGLNGLEPSTSRLSGVRSNQLKKYSF